MAKNNESNIYLAHIKDDKWSDMHAYHLENAIFWRHIAYFMIFSLVCVVSAAMYFINQDKHKTLIFEKDSLGNITLLGLASKTFTVDNKMVAHQLANFIIALREVPSSTSLKKRNIELVHAMVSPKIKNLVDQILVTQYANNKDVIVTINQIKPLSDGKSWIISWQETQNTNNNSLSKTSYYSSVISFTLLENVNPKIQLLNPIGLFIEYINPTEDINRL
jgi:type IV secretory pathway TrbF-like protein